MSLRSLGVLARQRRGLGDRGAAASSADDGALRSLEAAVPTEVIALYTSIIAGCEAVLRDDPADGYFAFRLAVYLVGLFGTGYVATRSVAAADRARATTSGGRADEADDDRDTGAAGAAVTPAAAALGPAADGSQTTRSPSPRRGTGWFDRITGAAASPEVLTATAGFAAWGLVLPGSFVYVWLSRALLTITVVTVTAVATFLFAVVFAPRLTAGEESTPSAGPPLTDQSPVDR